MKNKNNFAVGNIYKHIIALAVPMTIAQLVQVIYNIVDRIYIGHLQGTSSLALTGIGLTFPVITLVMAVTNLFGMGGAPLCSIARGKQDIKRAENIVGNTFSMLLIFSFLLMIFVYLNLRTILFLFGASEESYVYAARYMNIYLLGTPFIMIGSGMNGFINAQGFGKTGMITVLAGAIVNILLDPIFIFYFDMGIAGAALATVISQFISAAWVMSFLLGKKTLLKITRDTMRIKLRLVKEIVTLGFAGCLMAVTGALVQISSNTMLRDFGGDIYVGVMTVVNSIRDVVILPAMGLGSAAQPVLGYNYGAKEYKRIKKAINFLTIVTSVYILLTWIGISIYTEDVIKIFSNSPELVSKGVRCVRIYFFAFIMMALQVSGQSVFVGLGASKYAITFTLLRKVIIVVPLTLILPRIANIGVDGVFLAEPISDFIGGTACYLTMLYLIRKMLRREDA